MSPLRIDGEDLPRYVPPARLPEVRAAELRRGAGQPPGSGLGLDDRHMTLVFEVRVRDRRRRERDEVAEVISFWALRRALRIARGWSIDGWSPTVYPGATYPDWWFGKVEVYLIDRRER